MKIQNESLVRFIQDFQLESKDSTICFEARIVYTTLKKQFQLPSEVHIIRLQQTGLELIYLLDPDIEKYGIPGKIEDVNSIYYNTEGFLYIKGTSMNDGNYILSIHPTGAACNPSALKELFAKTYN